MSTVCSTTLLGSLVDLDMLDNQIPRIQTLGIGIGLGVFQQSEQMLSRLDGPASARNPKLFSCSAISQAIPSFPPRPQKISINAIPSQPLSLAFPRFPRTRTPLRTLGCASRSSGVASHGHGFLVLDYIVEIGDCASEFPAVDRLGCFSRVLEGDAQVGAAGAGGFGGLEVRCCIADLWCCGSWCQFGFVP